MEFNELLYKRRSVRFFADRSVSREEIDRLLTAATRAPSACNMQSWHFYAVTDPGVRAKFTEFSAPWVATAPVIFAVCTDEAQIVGKFGDRAKIFPIQDTSLAIENLLLAAADMGLGGCFIGAFDAEKCRRALDIPDKFEIIALVPIGEPTEEPPVRERKSLDEVVTYI